MSALPGPRACVMGHRVTYSRSPMLHGYWLRTLALPGSYDLVDIPPKAFAEFICNLSSHGYVGGNVTTPHKDAAFHLVDRRDQAALAVGAVNTVWLEAGRLVGSNTDVEGYLINLDDAAPGWDRGGGRATVIGAGGAARAVVHALLERGFDVAIVNRSFDRAQALAEHFGKKPSVHGFSDLARILRDTRVLTNTSSLGAAGQPSLDIDLEPLSDDAVVCDIVYVPLETRLLQAARGRGLRTADGLGMLMYQAVPGFSRWFGVRPQVSRQLRSMLEADIRSRSGGG